MIRNCVRPWNWSSFRFLWIQNCK